MIVIVGMEGVLISVVGGLVDWLVIVVLISVGYGIYLNGFILFLLMFNSCLVGISVVNIDNGFGVVYNVSMINYFVKEE